MESGSRIISAYERDGVVCVSELFSRERLSDIQAALARYAGDVLPGLAPGDVVYEADGRTVRNLWRMQIHDRFFEDLATRPDLIELVTTLVHGDPVLMAVELFGKPARVGSSVPAHQDNAYFCWEPPDAVTVWVALDAVTEENGPVSYIQGSHRLGTLAHRASGVAGNSMGLVGPIPEHAPYAPTLAPGDALIHHANTIHYSAPNTSDQSRRALLMVYRGAHCIEDKALLQRYRGTGT